MSEFFSAEMALLLFFYKKSRVSSMGQITQRIYHAWWDQSLAFFLLFFHKHNTAKSETYPTELARAL